MPPSSLEIRPGSCPAVPLLVWFRPQTRPLYVPVSSPGQVDCVGSSRAGLNRTFPCEALSMWPAHRRPSYSHSFTWTECRPKLTHSLKSILGVLPLKITLKLYPDSKSVLPQMSLILHKSFHKVPSSPRRLSSLLKLASASAHLRWKRLGRCLQPSCSSLQGAGPIQRDCEQTLVLIIGLERPLWWSSSTSSFYREENRSVQGHMAGWQQRTQAARTHFDCLLV